MLPSCPRGALLPSTGEFAVLPELCCAHSPRGNELVSPFLNAEAGIAREGMGNIGFIALTGGYPSQQVESISMT